MLAELLEDAEQSSVGGRVFGAEFLEVISIEASNEMVELSDTDVETLPIIAERSSGKRRLRLFTMRQIRDLRAGLQAEVHIDLVLSLSQYACVHPQGRDHLWERTFFCLRRLRSSEDL